MIGAAHRAKLDRVRVKSDRSRSHLRLAPIGLALLAVVAALGCSQHRIPDGPPLQIHRQTFGYKYTYNSPAEQPVWTWTGSMHPAFVATLERHPAALEQARTAQPLYSASQILSLAYVGYGVKIAFLSWETDRLGLRHFNASGADWAILGGLFGAALVTGNMARSRLDAAVSVFNTEETASDRQENAQRSLLARLQFSPIYQSENSRVGLLARLRLR